MPMRWSTTAGKIMRSNEDWRPAELLPSTSVPGFSEAVGRTADYLADLEPFRAPQADALPEEPEALRHEPPRPVFASDGPEGHRDRMRDRLLDRGPDGLADYELLEMLLFLVQPKGDTKPLAKRLINQFGSYARVVSAPVHELTAIPHVGRHTAAAIKLMHGGAVRLARAEVIDQPILSNWDQLMAYLNAVMAREKVEQFRILFLDTKNRLIADELQGRGTINHTPVYPREVTRRAFELHAASLILVHNHPSGDPTPSVADLDMTRQIQRILQPLGIALHDHIIVGNGSWISLKKEGFV